MGFIFIGFAGFVGRGEQILSSVTLSVKLMAAGGLAGRVVSVILLLPNRPCIVYK